MLRGLRESDAEDVAGLFRAAFGDERPIDAAEIVSWFKNEELKPDWLRVLELEGQVVGYGDIQIEGNELALDVAAPGHWETFFEWAEERARAEDLGRVRVFLPAGHETERLADARGYRLWRSAYTMNVDLEDEEPEVPHAPEGITFHPYREGDEESLRRALNEAFARTRSTMRRHRRTSASSISGSAPSIRRFGCSRGTRRSWRDSCSRFLSVPAKTIWGGSRCSASASHGVVAASVKRSSAQQSVSCTREACAGSGSVSTLRTKQGP